MPVDWAFSHEVVRLGGTGPRKIAPEDGARQQETARSILADLTVQPGVVLADEVGMGKTYVALGVIASVVRASRHSGRPVVVMVPSGLASKWPREWDQFKAFCCIRPEALEWIRDAYAHTPTDFFKLIARPRDRRPHIIWMTTGCFGRGLSDPWTKLALVRLARLAWLARSRTKMDEETKKKLCKWAATLVRLKRKRRLTPELVEQLLRADLSRWHRILVREEVIDREDDPVPEHLLHHQGAVDWSPLTQPRLTNRSANVCSRPKSSSQRNTLSCLVYRTPCRRRRHSPRPSVGAASAPQVHPRKVAAGILAVGHPGPC